MKTAFHLRQKGLSLVETMIALTLGAIVTVGVIQLFVANSETYNLMQGQSRMQESARFALDFLGRGIQMAGYKGCFSENEDVFTTLSPEDAIPYEYDLRRGLVGYDAQGVGWNPALTGNGFPDTVDGDSVIPGNGVPADQVMEGTDVITIRRLSSTEAPLATEPVDTEDVVVTTPASGVEFLSASRGNSPCAEGPNKICVDDLIMIHDCEKSTIFRVTDIATSAGETTIGHDTADIDPTANDREGLAEVNSYRLDAAVSAIHTNIFYIAPGEGVNNQGDNPLSLWRKMGTDPPVELVEGVEDLQVLYGEDTNGDGTPNIYNTANVVSDYGDIVTVRLSITVNSVDDVGATSAPTHGCISDGGLQPCIPGESYDGLLRRTFHQTVQLRNKG